MAFFGFSYVVISQDFDLGGGVWNAESRGASTIMNAGPSTSAIDGVWIP